MGSVYLASILLKLGGYGFFRLIIEMLPGSNIFFLPVSQSFALYSLIYSSLVILVQTDIKKIIAYSSIAHMNLAVLGIFVLSSCAKSGAIYMMLAHGFTSGALFFLVGLLYDRYKTRLVTYFGGLFIYMPIYSFFFIFFCLANSGFPGTANFIGEILLITGLMEYSFLTQGFAIFSLIYVSVFSSVCYSFPLINRLLFGNVKLRILPISFPDLSLIELSVILPFFILVLLMGLDSNFVTSLIHGYFTYNFIISDLVTCYDCSHSTYINDVK